MSVTGVLAHADPATSSAYESSLERDLQLLFEFDDAVASIEEQPVRIAYADAEGRSRHYTPDLLVRYRHDHPAGRAKAPLLCEVKYRDELRIRIGELRPKLRAAARYARSRHWRFRLFTERDIRTPYLLNVRFLRQYRALRVTDEDCAVLVEALRELRESDPETLLASIYEDRWNRAQILPVLWALVARRVVGADLNSRLNMRSRIWLL
jgi:hypothetical protein